MIFSLVYLPVRPVLAVAELVRPPEWALDESPVPTEHGVQWGVAGDGIAEVLEGRHSVLAVA